MNLSNIKLFSIGVYLTGLLCVFYSTATAQVKAKFTITPANGCSPLYVAFTNGSTGTGTLTYKWKFGINGGLNSIIKDPSTTYPSCGTYTVVLIVSNGTSTDTAKNIVTVYCNPIVGLKYNISAGCPGTCIMFTDTSKAGSGTIIKRVWDFGDGSVLDSNVTNVQHCYSTPGLYSVSVQITNSHGCTVTKKFSDIVNIYQRPVIAFTPSYRSACSSPFTINFTNNTHNGSGSSGALKYYWNFGDPGSGSSDTSTQANPSHSFSTGTYSVTLIASDINGCVDTLIKKNEIIIGSTTLSITPATDSGCCPLHVKFTTVSTLVPSSYSWNFGGAASSDTSASPAIVVPCPATRTSYKVKLTANYAGGCSVTATSSIVVFPRPKANFKMKGDTNTCAPTTNVNFVNTSSPLSGTNFVWNIGGNNYGVTTPGAAYLTSCGSYAVRLIATGTNGCSDTLLRKNAIIIKCAKVNFRIKPKAICVGGSVTFVADTFPSFKGKYIWNFGDGDSSTTSSNITSHSYGTLGCFTVKLKVKFDSLCSASAIKVDSVCTYKPPTVYFTAIPPVSCPQKIVNFRDSITGLNTPGDTVKWAFGDGGTAFVHDPKYQYNDTGYFTVTLTACNYGCCTNFKRHNYEYIYPPIAIPSVPFRCDSPYIRHFDGSSSIGADHYTWIFGDTLAGASDSSHLMKVSYLYKKRGDYPASLTVYNDSSHCKHTSRALIRIRELHARFTYTKLAGCSPQVIKCVNTSQDYATAHWQVIYDESKSIIYQSDTASFLIDTVKLPGHYKVKLLVTDVNGCKDSIVHDTVITVYGFIAGFSETPYTGCPPLNASFTNTSYSPTSVAVRYHWNFGDTASKMKDSSSLKNPSHIYSKTGCYNVSLTIYDNHGCASTIAVPNVVCIVKPKADFVALQRTACAYSPVYFQATNVAPGVASFKWDFGDPSSGTSNNSTVTTPSHIYKTPGYYTIKLYVSTTLGCDTTIVKTNYIRILKPKAYFGTKDSTHAVCPPLTVHFKDSSSGSILAWKWTFGDSGTSALKNPANIYTKSGTFDVSLIVKDSFGCYDTFTRKQYIVIKGPIGTISFSPGRHCAPVRVFFKAHSSNAKYFIWDFGNTTSGKLQNADTISYLYTTPGVYYPKVILDNGFGCTRSIISPDSVVVTGFTAGTRIDPKDACPLTTPVYFSDTLIKGSPIVHQSWHFGDPSSGASDSSLLTNPTHTYSSPGTYIIKLNVNSALCYVTLYDTVKVHPKPSVRLRDISGNCYGDTTHFYDSTVHGALIVYRHWNFGDTSSLLNNSGNLNPSHIYLKAGTYKVLLALRDTYGCMDSVRVPVVIHELPLIKASNDTSICIFSSVALHVKGGVRYKWTPSKYLTSDTVPNPVSTPKLSIKYTVLVKDTEGCPNVASINVNVNPLPNVKAFPDTTICQHDSVKVFATGAKAYQWSPTTYLSGASGAALLCVPLSFVNYVVTGTDNNGCINKDTLYIKTWSLPVVIARPDTGVCIGASVTLRASGAVSYKWSPATSLSSTTASNPVTNTTTSITYRVTGIDGHGCVNKDSAKIIINPLPVIKTTNDTAVCIKSPVHLNASGGTKYKWSPASYLSNDTIANPVSTPLVKISYKVIVTDKNNCRDSAVVHINTHPLPTVNAKPDTSVCYKDSVEFSASGAISYKWSPAAYLSNSAISNPICNPPLTVKYVVTGTDNIGCSNNDTITIKVNQLPVLKINKDTGICAGDTVQLNATGAKTYRWWPGTYLSNVNISNPKANPKSSLRYYLTASDSNNCHNKDSVLINIYSLPVIVVTRDTFVCPFEAVQLKASGASSYKWTPPLYLDNDSIANPVGSLPYNIKSITYIVTGTDVRTCQNKAKVTITLNPLPQIKISATSLVCLHDSAIISASGAKFYAWSPATYLNKVSGNTILSRPLGNIFYYVKGTDSLGCYNFDTIFIRIDSLPQVYVTPDTAVCIGSKVQVSINGLKNNIYVWSPPTYLSSNTISNPVITPAVTTTYQILVIDSNGCKNHDTVRVRVNALPVVVAGPDTTICDSVLVQLHAGMGFVTYKWSPDSFLSFNNIRNPIAKPQHNITYSVKVTDANGCVNTGFVKLITRPLPNIKAFPDTSVCISQPVQLNATGGITYVWEPPTYLTNNLIANPLATPISKIDYYVVGTDVFGCSNHDSLHINIYKLPVITAGPDTTICVGNSVYLWAKGGVSYNWSPKTYLNNSDTAKPLATPPDTMKFFVRVVDEHGCVSDTSVLVNVVQKIKKVISGTDTLCFGESVNIFASGGIIYAWTPNYAISSTNIPNPVVVPGITTRYHVAISDGLCFSDTGSILVIVNPLPTITVGPHTYSVIAGNQVLIGSYNALKGRFRWTPPDYLLTPDSSITYATPPKTTKYLLTFTNSQGCSATDSIVVNVLCKGAEIFVPDAFAPGDSKYSLFKVHPQNIKEFNYLRIFDRWGKLLFETKDMNQGWDGTFNGEQLEPGVYVYYVSAVCSTEEPIFLKGNITLIR